MKKLFIETYGCQMNVADSEVVASIMQMAGYDMCEKEEEADAIFLNTCSIRENAENKIYHRLETLHAEQKKGRKVILGVLGCMAVGAGFGYYSLSSIFITEYKGPELGTIALLSNITREIITLLFAPLLVRWFGNLAPISAGGATTMDTTLPIITRYSGQSFVVVSIFHGFVVDFSVPFLVTLFCSI